MGLGVLDAGNGAKVPGTANILDDINQSAAQTEINAALKYDRSGKTPIILVPQPSDDPNDPLNWPLRKRDGMLVILCLISIVASTLSPLLAANTVTLSLQFHTKFEFMAQATGYHLAGVGVAGFIFVASARIWGKRHLYLLGTILIIVSSAWGGSTVHGKNYTSLLWARIIQGVGLAPFEALVNASVGDMYFVHERGVRMAMSNMALFGGAFFTPILVGLITHTIGWEWSFYLIAICAGALLPFIFFFLPETTFNRPEHFNANLVERQRKASNSGSDENGSRSVDSLEKNRGGAAINGVHNGDHPIPAKVSFTQSLMPFNGRHSPDSFWKLCLRPFPLFFHPAIFWACLTQGTLIGWTVLIGVVLAAIFLGPPLWFNEVTTGYMYVGAFLGALIGFAIAGVLADWSTKAMIRRNKGVYEPEFRIVLVLAQLVLGCTGLYGFGIVSANVQNYGKPAQWVLPDFFFACEVAGMVIGAVASALYIVDAHKDLAVEAFTCLLVFKNMFSFALTLKAFDWLDNVGVQELFIIVGSVQVGVCLLSVPMYVFGKRNRLLTSRYDILKMLHLY